MLSKNNETGSTSPELADILREYGEEYLRYNDGSLSSPLSYTGRGPLFR